MVQLKILTGRQAGLACAPQQFPCIVGRSASAEVRVDEDGVWDRHLEITSDFPEGFILKTLPNCLASINGQRFERAVLRNGDIIEVGLFRMQFSLKETQQKSLRTREVLTWLSLGILSFGQIGLVYWLSH